MEEKSDKNETTNNKYCPKCHHPLTEVGAFWICLQHGQVSFEKPHTALRIFLSYGHDANDELVRRIKADLEKRGHDVWFDKSEIKFGDEWRRSITDGILQSNRVLSFLSKHSTRDPGVCLDEIAIAIGAKGGNIQTILVESETEVKPPTSISHIQWLDMHDWKEQRDFGGTAWEQWYQSKLAEIVAVVESDESRRFVGEIKTLEDLLKPTTSDFAFDSRIRKLLEKKLVGRMWLFDAVEHWRVNTDKASRLFWIMGAPGIGKSAFAAHLAHEYGRGTVIAVQFCDWKKQDHRDPCRIIRTLAFQIATRFPDYRKLLLTLPIMTELDRKNSAELFDGLLTNPLQLSITGGRERYLIVIDALDEAGWDGRNELVELLARYAEQLPDWIGLVVTSRPEFDVTTPFQGLKPFSFETKSDDNSNDIRDYLHHELAVQLQNRPDADSLIEQILEKSEGVFLYVESFCEDIRKHYLSLNRPNEFPQGLGGIFDQYFKRLFPDLEKFRKDVRPALRAILAAREPLPVEILQRLFNWQDEELHDFTRPLASLFPVATEGGHEVIKPYHKSLADWISDVAKAGEYFISMMEGHRILAEFGEFRVKQLAGIKELQGIDVFWSHSLLYHCFKSQRWGSFINCIAEPNFFWKLATVSYGLGYFQSVFFGFSPNELVNQVLESLPSELRSRICWELAKAFSERAEDFQAIAFDFAKRYGEGSNTIRRYLMQNHPDEFSQLRDTIYSFAQLARIAAEFAVVAESDELCVQHDIKQYLDCFKSIHGYLHYLSNFASTEGWSGALENEASEAYFPWERLLEIAKRNCLERRTT